MASPPGVPAVSLPGARRREDETTSRTFLTATALPRPRDSPFRQNAHAAPSKVGVRVVHIVVAEHDSVEVVGKPDRLLSDAVIVGVLSQPAPNVVERALRLAPGRPRSGRLNEPPTIFVLCKRLERRRWQFADDLVAKSPWGCAPRSSADADAGS